MNINSLLNPTTSFDHSVFINTELLLPINNEDCENQKKISPPIKLKRSSRRGPYRSYKWVNKQEVLDIDDAVGTEHAAFITNIPQSTIYNWKRKRDNNEDILPKGKRKCGGGARRALTENEEQELVNWITDLREDGMVVTKNMLRVQALTIFDKADWKCSTGWINGFMERRGWSLRTPTEQKGSKIDINERNNKIERFWQQSIRIQKLYNIEPSQIFNMDEVPINWDMVPNRTINKQGAFVQMGQSYHHLSFSRVPSKTINQFRN